MILVVLSTRAELESATTRGRTYWETGQLHLSDFYLYDQLNNTLDQKVRAVCVDWSDKLGKIVEY